MRFLNHCVELYNKIFSLKEPYVRMGRKGYVAMIILAAIVFVVTYFHLNYFFDFLDEQKFIGAVDEMVFSWRVATVLVFSSASMFVLLCAATWKRINHVGMNGWWVFLLLVPIINIFFIVYLMIKKGEEALVR